MTPFHIIGLIIGSILIFGGVLGVLYFYEAEDLKRMVENLPVWPTTWTIVSKHRANTKPSRRHTYVQLGLEPPEEDDDQPGKKRYRRRDQR